MLSDRDLLARLVAFASVSRVSNRPIADELRNYLDRPGVRITDMAMPGSDKVNLVIESGPPSRDRGGLVLSGHMDVVPAEEANWKSDPFQLRYDGVNWYGRGTCDMKASVAMATNLFIESLGAKLTQPLVLILTCDEEVGSLGAQHVAQHWPRDQALPRSVLVGEPTSLRAVRMHKGHLTMKIEVRGKAAHSGSPQLGRNAIEAAIPLLQRLKVLRSNLEMVRVETSRYFSEVPFPVLNLARVHAGDALNVVPASCIIELGLRLLPGQDSKETMQNINAVVVATKTEEDVEMSLQALNDNPPMLTSDDAPLHRALCAMLSQRETHGVSFASDGGPLRRDLGLDCVLFGPGNIEVAHRANEHVPIAEVARARQTVAALIHQFCMS
jgi:acetylornithine deacetylase